MRKEDSRRSNLLRSLCTSWVRKNKPEVYEELVKLARTKYPVGEAYLKYESVLEVLMKEVKNVE